MPSASRIFRAHDSGSMASTRAPDACLRRRRLPRSGAAGRDGGDAGRVAH
ncbi:hypothetical protein GLE_0380 [Lysobacter enzymogenes]|uniref:Uncharacterized protein n=1 Tax=Lysobacter enzymogenes TaxID=69 RepID=A0A0S2DB43_LYSEN|nr:hypothetical protein GLE_0380 [Lysobacter enzymogenes]